jgi:hypothetical protein
MVLEHTCHVGSQVRRLFSSIQDMSADLVFRAAKRFKYQEEGRKVVRDWAEWVVDVGEGLDTED